MREDEIVLDGVLRTLRAVDGPARLVAAVA
jgi:hypothetical protein